MNNGDMPAMPVMDEVEYYGQHYGLTKREMLAMNAPSDIPIWFRNKWSIENEGRENLVHSDLDEYSEPSVLTTSITANGEEALYFAWRTYYADALLSQLQEEKG